MLCFLTYPNERVENIPEKCHCPPISLYLVYRVSYGLKNHLAGRGYIANLITILEGFI